MSEATEAIRAKLRADYDRIQALPPDKRSRVEHERQRQADGLVDYVEQQDDRTVDEILDVGQTRASRAERAAADAKAAPGRAKLAQADRDRRAASDESMRKHAARPLRGLHHSEDADFPEDTT
jgi:hypothetical protein